MTIRPPSQRAPWRQAAWRMAPLVVLAMVGYAGWRTLTVTPYRIDIDVYRMGGRAWLNGSPLYDHGVLFHTQGGLDLPFTYPPLAAVCFAPFALLSLPAASATITVVTFALLVATVAVLLRRLGLCEGPGAGRPWVRRLVLAAGLVAPAMLYLEPIRSNFDFGQINVVLMTLVVVDLVPRRTPWPRGLLLGLAIALKLTPAVFLLYLFLRRDVRAVLTTAAAAVAATAVGFAMAPRDSWLYWTETVRDTDRIGTATYHTNQNIAGTLARLGLGENSRYLLWVLACLAVLAVTTWAVRAVLREPDRFGEDGDAAAGTVRAGDREVLALICVAMFGLVVSPVSWSHHWVWALPAVIVSVVLGVRYRNAALGMVGAVGVALMAYAPLDLMPKHRETTAALWRQLVGSSYVWWALVLLVVAGSATLRRERMGTVDAAAPVAAAS